MTTYFDAVGDLALLPSELRDAGDLVNVAALAEVDVINQYTRRARDSSFTIQDPTRADPLNDESLGTPLIQANSGGVQVGSSVYYVYLAGYVADASQAADPFKTDMKREIAGVVAWRLRQNSVDPMVQTDNAGGKGKTYRSNVTDPFPPGFGRWIAKYDNRPAAWGL